MKKYFLIDERIRKEEYDLLSKYGHVITIQKNNSLYECCNRLRKIFPNFPEPEKEESKESFSRSAKYA